MSGRKASEVYAVLSRIEGGLGSVKNAYRCDIEELRTTREQIRQKIQEQQELIIEEKIHFSKETENRLGDQAQKVCKTFEGTQQSIQRTNLNPNWNDLQHLTDMLNGIQEIEKSAEKIRGSVLGFDYNNGPYADATRLGNELNGIVGELRHGIATERGRTTQLQRNLSDIKQKYLIMEECKKQAKKLEEQAQFLQMQQDKADSLKDDISKTIDDFDEELFKRFQRMKELHEEYNSLKREARNFLQQDDSAVIDNYSQIQCAITDLQSRVRNHVEQQKALKQESIELFQQNKKSIDINQFMDCLTGEEQVLNLQEFIDRYELPITLDKLKELLQEQKTLSDKDLFQEALDRQGEVTQELELVKAEAIRWQENIRSGVNNGIRLREAMKGMYYDVEIVAKAGVKNPRDGYVITASAGNDVIDFDVHVDDDAQLSLDINHLDRNGNDAVNCEKSWNEIRTNLTQHGIYVHDITKDGNSVLGSPKSQTQKVQKKKDKTTQNSSS